MSKTAGILALVMAAALATAAMAQEKKAEAKAGERQQKKLLDNDRVLVTETTFKPGDVTPSVERPYRITRVIQGGESLRTFPDGKTQKWTWKTGDVLEVGPDKPYASKNVGKTTIILYTVTPKQKK
jgi:quercetin dioxygenase-like cupin family protein